MKTPSWQEEVWQWVAAVPAGNVASYGQIATLAGHPSHARQVGAILRQLPKGSTLPWHRILCSNGELGMPPGSAGWQRQCRLLAAEGVTLVNGRVRMASYQWRP